MQGPADAWTPKERRALTKLRSPAQIQAFLDSIAYSTESAYRCPRRVLDERRAHCFDGAVFAAAALRLIGHEPILIDLEAVRDDDHVLAAFRSGTCWGAIAKSNCSGIRFREPVYRSVRELAMSYFEQYFNTVGEKTLRRVSVPVRLSRFDRRGWIGDDACMDAIADALIDARHAELLTPRQIKALTKVDKRSYDAGFLGSDPKGLYWP